MSSMKQQLTCLTNVLLRKGFPESRNGDVGEDLCIYFNKQESTCYCDTTLRMNDVFYS